MTNTLSKPTLSNVKKFLLYAVGYILVLVLFSAIGLWSGVNDSNKPVVYRSTSTNEIVRVEVRGTEIPVEDLDKYRRYNLIWVK